jgi:hypothetical protein
MCEAIGMSFPLAVRISESHLGGRNLESSAREIQQLVGNPKMIALYNFIIRQKVVPILPIYLAGGNFDYITRSGCK